MLRARGEMEPCIWLMTNRFGRLGSRRSGRGGCVFVFCGWSNKLPQPRGLTHRKFILSWSSRPEVQNHSVSWLGFLWRLQGRIFSCLFPVSGGCCHSLAWGPIPPGSASGNIFLPPLCGQISFCPSSFKDICDCIQGSRR